MSDPHWRSIIENAPFDINEKPKRSIKVPFQIDLNNPNEVEDEMERIVAEFTKNKGKLVDYKVSTISGFDEKTNEVKGKCKLKPYKSYFAFEIREGK